MKAVVFVVGPKLRIRIKPVEEHKYEWYRWFAWYPVRLSHHHEEAFVWLTHVYRWDSCTGTYYKECCQ